jgi:membrane protease YdiL (CAAX protease family)
MLSGDVTLPAPPVRRSIELGLVFLLFVLPAYLAVGSQESAGLGPALLPLILTACPQTALIIYLLAIQGEVDRPDMGLARPRTRDLARASLVLAGMLAVLGAAALGLSLAPEATRAALTKGTRFRLQGWSELPAALLFCALAAFREELLYRAYLFVRLKDIGLSPAASVSASSVLFAAAHAYQGPLAVALALAQAVLLAAAFTRWKSITVPTVAHAAHNLLVLASTLLPGGGLPL